MKTFSKILLLSALLFAICHTETCTALTGMGVTSNTPQCIIKPVQGLCKTGFHLANKQCLPNTWYCSKDKYHAATSNCISCKWYAFHVQNDVQTKNGTKTGNFCETRWWFVTMMSIVSFVMLLLLLGAMKYFCCRPKTPKDKKRLLKGSNKLSGSNAHSSSYNSNPYHSNQQVVEVHQSRPVHHTRPAQVVSSTGHQVRTSYSPYKSHGNEPSGTY